MRARIRRALIISAIFSLSACTTIEAATKQTVRYNSAFTNARNEILLMNILRAKNREPLQFSTISNVTGAMRGNITLATAFEWALHGDDKFTPGGGFTFRDPAVTITPLDSKEFRQGMMEPVTVDFVSELLAQGWSDTVVLHLVVGGFDCGKAPKLNEGDDASTVVDFTNFANKTTNWDLVDDDIRVVAKKDERAAFQEIEKEGRSYKVLPSTPEDQPDKVRIQLKPLTTIVVGAAEGAKILREGAGEDFTAKLVPSAKEDASGTVRLVLDTKIPKKVVGIHAIPTCPTELSVKKVLLRSPEGMIQYLGKLVALQERASLSEPPLFKLLKGNPTKRNPDQIEAEFRNERYYVPQSEQSSLETLALLAEIIGFQTTNAELNASKPTVTVPAAE